ncbi:MAG TPA: Rieske 2Fe-2S domain-containing protein [Vicinamibacteria bacterium]|nr:Rieske 2Fe-2S domain-containing protein [Vicinamibacteria bacterium]
MRHRVASIDEIPESGGIAVDVGEKRIALFRHQGEVFALDETCPHRGGPLHDGTIDRGVVHCPWHQWQFDLKTGCSPVNPLSRVKVYPVRLEGTDVLLEMD